MPIFPLNLLYRELAWPFDLQQIIYMGCKRLFQLYLLIFTAFFSSVSHADLATQLAQSRTWSRLLHFEADLLSSPRSAISTDHFFFSAQGQTDREAELLATLEAFTLDPQQQCRFPARSRYLHQHFPHLPTVICHEFDNFLTAINAQSLSLLYASGYLGNPASMYGHVFIKFNNTQQEMLLDNTYNYGARFPADENPFVYIGKGIFGGYQGYFANQEFHHQTLIYNQTELRDLWEYKLALSQDQIEFLLAHLWELENISMSYYFFKQNCAYQLAHLLEMVLDVELLAPGKIWVMPYDIIMMLERNERQQETQSPLIAGVYFHPSRQETLYSKYAQLSLIEQKYLVDSLRQTPSELQQSLLSLPEPSAKRIIDTLYDYFAYLDSKNDQLTPEHTAIRKVALSARLHLPPGKSDFTESVKKPPHQAQDTSLVQIRQHYQGDLGSSTSLRFRANYYDLLSVNSARIPFSELSTFDLTTSYYNKSGKMYLDELTLLRITNLNAANSGLPEDSAYAWKAATGYQTLHSEHASDGTFYAEGFIGKGIAFDLNMAVYAALSGRITTTNVLGGYLALGPEVGGVMQLSPEYALSISAQHQRYLNDWQVDRTVIQFEQRFFNHKKFDLRALLKYDRQVNYSMALSFYY